MVSDRNIAIEMLQYIREKYPHLNVPDFLRQHFARVVLGELPPYSGRHKSGYQINAVTTVTASSCAICYAYDAAAGDWVFVATKKRLGDGSCDTRIALLGGFTNLDQLPDKDIGEGEQPAEGLIREISEETLDASSQPLLSIQADRLCLIYSGIDYRGWEQGLQGTHNTGFSVHLTPEEFHRIKRHANRTQSDKVYSMAVSIATNNEVAQIVLIPAKRLIDMSTQNFRNPSELRMLLTFFAAPNMLQKHNPRVSPPD